MYIDFKKINANYCSLPIERVEEIKDLATKERVFLMNKYHTNNNISTILSSKAYEIAYVNVRNSELNDVEKNILANNIVFDDDKFATILKKGNFDLTYLDSFIKLVNYMKYKTDNNKLANSDQRYLTTIYIYAKKIVDHFTKYVGNVDKYIIINKLNEIITFNPEILENKKNKFIR